MNSVPPSPKFTTLVNTMSQKLSQKLVVDTRSNQHDSDIKSVSDISDNSRVNDKSHSRHLEHQILEGTTWHARHKPNKHSFQYPYRYWGLNLNKLVEQSLPSVPALFAESLPALHRFCYTDYFDINKLDDSNSSNAEYLHNRQANTATKQTVRQKLRRLRNTATKNSASSTNNRITAQAWLTAVNNEWQRLTGSRPTGEVLALVVSRNVGFYFSPVNFYVGFDREGTASHLLAEVSNTPWNKSHYYGFRLENYHHGESMSFSHKKSFHVSPFNPLDQVYEWRFRLDSSDRNQEMLIERLQVSIHVHDARGKVFAAGINMTATPLTTASIGASIRQNPIMSHSSMARIYWHAVQLYVVKKIPYVAYNQALKDSKQAKNDNPEGVSDIHQHSNKNSHEDEDTITSRNINNTHRKSKGYNTMNELKKLPTNRALASSANSLLEKITAHPILSPVNKGIDAACKALFYKILEQFQFGSISLTETYGTQLKPKIFTDNTDKEAVKNSTNNSTNNKNSDDRSSQIMGEVVGSHPLHIAVKIHDPSFYQKLITGGSIALADSYINGEWDVDDLTALIRLGSRNEQAMSTIETKLSKVTKMLEFSKHKLRSNTINNSKSNILAHYDLGNEMYKTFLDDSMMYSSGIYPTPHTPLAEAQQLKLHTLCEQLELSADDSVIEIGTGWGGFALYAASHYGCHVTTTTISDAQYEEAKRRVEAAGLSDKITVLKQDYRNLTGHYDKLISIEMVEAVGHEYLPTFFSKCNELLKPNGVMVIQAITFNDQGYDDYLNSIDFIQSHIFPGGCLLSNQEIINQFTQETDMVVKSLVDYGYDYAHTLRDWRHAFMSRRDEIQAMGYDDSFIRLWHFYFAFCEGGFLEKIIGVVQVKAVKPAHR